MGWLIEEGSVLDADYLHRPGQLHVVYSLGVLPHTGSMWQALSNVASPEAIFRCYHERGFVLLKLVTPQGLGCNEFVFIKQTE
jgi:hypothetical protein